MGLIVEWFLPDPQTAYLPQSEKNNQSLDVTPTHCKEEKAYKF